MSLGVLFAEADAQQAFARLAAVSIPLGARVMQYLTLFTPPKSRLTVAKQVKLVLSLLPDLERQAIASKGREWTVPHALWAQGIDQMLAARDAARLDLPMKGHAYLYAILAGLADRHEGEAESKREAARKAQTRPGQAEGAASLASLLPTMPTASSGPVPLCSDEQIKKAVPMPEALRAQLLKRRPG
nr:hypothetical protein [Roseateles oligotrophus]